MRRIAIRGTNALLFVLCCFIAGGVVSDIAAALLLSPSPGGESWQPSEPWTPSDTPWTQRQVILNRNVFDALVRVEDQVEAPPEQAPEPEGPIEATALPLALLGTVAGPESVARAVIEDKGARAHEVLGVGDFLKNHQDVRVVRIERRRVILDNAGVSEQLSLDEEGAGAAPQARQAPSRRTRSTAKRETPTDQRASSRNRLADRLKTLRETARENPPTSEEMEEELDGLNMRTQMELFSQARIMPKYEDGEMIGIQLNKIQAGSYYEKVGLKDGDIITSVNGIPIDKPAASPIVIDELAGAPSLSIEYLDASGQPQVLNVETNSLLEGASE